jgi:hypothetical protein
MTHPYAVEEIRVSDKLAEDVCIQCSPTWDPRLHSIARPRVPPTIGQPSLKSASAAAELLCGIIGIKGAAISEQCPSTDSSYPIINN